MTAITSIAAGPSPDLSEDRPTACGLSLAEQLDAEAAAMEAPHLARVEALARAGMALVGAVERRVARIEAAPESDATAAGDGARDTGGELAELGLVYNRAARAVRLTMILEKRMREARRARLLGLEAERAQAAQAKAEAREQAEAALERAETVRIEARADEVVQRVVETVQLAQLRRCGADAADLEELNADDVEYDEHEQREIDDAFAAAERMLARSPAYADFDERPISAVVAQICADLGLTPDWRLWAKEDWALDEAEAVPDSPFAGLVPGWAARGPP